MNKTLFFILLTTASFVLIVLSLLHGRYNISLQETWMAFAALFSEEPMESSRTSIIIFSIRLPRIIAAFVVGGTLAVTGATYQGMFRNPMVSPSILGVSAGAAFGAALAILLGLGAILQQGLSFAFGLLAILGVYLISLSTGKKYDKSLTLILSGMIVGTVFSAFISMLKYVADPQDTLPSIVYWLMGGFSEITFSQVWPVLIIALLGLLYLSLSGAKLDMLSFGDDEAKTMGLNVEKFRFTVISIATLMTASAVSISGIIGWVGLLIPHISRMLIGSKNKLLLPASFFIGGMFLLIVDDFSRTISSMELPLGITTSLIGAPFFIFILMRTSKMNR